MPTRNSASSGILTKKMLDFVTAWHGDALAAARAAGYKSPKASAEQLMNNPIITDAIKKKQDTLAQESGRLLAKELTFCRADVLNRIWEIANPSSSKDKPSFETQLKAAQALAEIFDNGINRVAELARQLQGKTEAEVEFFAAHGYFPEPGDQDNVQTIQVQQS